jgi:hypothetical protein
MPTKKSRKSEPDGAVFLTAPQVCQRYANRSHMWLERMLQKDSTFPRPVKFGRLRFFKIDELVDWERKTAAKSTAA